MIFGQLTGIDVTNDYQIYMWFFCRHEEANDDGSNNETMENELWVGRRVSYLKIL
jgi:hypothetical protein